jgi:site-specific DNA-methyltransferase (cytosine-N4-specific)
MGQAELRLKEVDWDFTNAPANRGIHAIHPYPAKFIPQIPRQLIELYYPADESVILDPFCGSGTTLVETISLGVNAWGIDLHPLACLIAQVKTTPLHPQFARAAGEVVGRARTRLARGEVNVPSIPNLNHWFKIDVQKTLAALIGEIDSIPSSPTREALRVAFSSIVVRVSNQESDTRYAAIEKTVRADDIFNLFDRAAANIYEAVSSFRDDLFRSFGKVSILNRDILSVSPEELPKNVGLVITSPPYPNAYEYWLYHKYRMYWLGMNPIAVKEREIGARPHYFKTNHQDERDFEKQMAACFALLSRVMLPNAKACFLVGRSIIHGRVIDNMALLKRAAEPHGFEFEEAVERHIPANRKTFNPSHARIIKEHVIIFSLACPQ